MPVLCNYTIIFWCQASVENPKYKCNSK